MELQLDWLLVMSLKIKDIYKEDEEAVQFMQNNPDMFGWTAESSHDRPGNAQWACTEPAIDKVEKAHTIQEALRSYPKGRERTALEMYYDGKKFSDIQSFLKHKLKSSTIKFIWKVKGKVLAHAKVKKRKKLNMKHRSIVAQNTFEMGDEKRSVFLVHTPKSGAYIWVDQNYRVLPEDVQDYLDMRLTMDKKYDGL